jgi:hypothetical protein
MMIFASFREDATIPPASLIKVFIKSFPLNDDLTQICVDESKNGVDFRRAEVVTQLECS